MPRIDVVNLVASMLCRNELERYLPEVIGHLREFCDRIIVVDDKSTDGSYEWLLQQSNWQLTVAGNLDESFDEHEGKLRQRLLDVTLAMAPEATHVLSIDADEFVQDGDMLRRELEEHSDAPAWTMTMSEIWKADETHLFVRMDGGWVAHEVLAVWRVPHGRLLKIPERQLAGGRVPRGIEYGTALPSQQILFHFGWTDPLTRAQRYARYMLLDGGQYHSRKHLESIVSPEKAMRLITLPWPDTAWAVDVREKLTR